jgi:hypothetical protein
VGRVCCMEEGERRWVWVRWRLGQRDGDCGCGCVGEGKEPAATGLELELFMGLGDSCEIVGYCVVLPACAFLIAKSSTIYAYPPSYFAPVHTRSGSRFPTMLMCRIDLYRNSPCILYMSCS